MSPTPEGGRLRARRGALGGVRHKAVKTGPRAVLKPNGYLRNLGSSGHVPREGHCVGLDTWVRFLYLGTGHCTQSVRDSASASQVLWVGSLAGAQRGLCSQGQGSVVGLGSGQEAGGPPPSPLLAGCIPLQPKD